MYFQNICHPLIDNCSENNLTEEILDIAESINTKLHFFPPNTTKVAWLFNCLVIQKLKAH